MKTPALLVAWLRLPKKKPLWVPDGSCIIMKGVEGWTLGPRTREPTHPLLAASRKHAYDLAKKREISNVLAYWEAGDKRLRWDIWAWQVKTKTWVQP